MVLKAVASEPDPRLSFRHFSRPNRLRYTGAGFHLWSGGLPDSLSVWRLSWKLCWEGSVLALFLCFSVFRGFKALKASRFCADLRLGASRATQKSKASKIMRGQVFANFHLSFFCPACIVAARSNIAWLCALFSNGAHFGYPMECNLLRWNCFAKTNYPDICVSKTLASNLFWDVSFTWQFRFFERRVIVDLRAVRNFVISAYTIFGMHLFCGVRLRCV